MNSFTLECSFFGKEISLPPLRENDPPRTKLIHLTLQDKLELGAQLVQSLESYLPREHNKLSILSGKILDAFYEEFIKFVPPYILKREEERKKQ